MGSGGIAVVTTGPRDVRGPGRRGLCRPLLHIYTSNQAKSGAGLTCKFNITGSKKLYILFLNECILFCVLGIK
jgi:hypothetical protein